MSTPEHHCPCCEAGLKTEKLAIVKADKIVDTTCPRCLVQIMKDGNVYRCPSCKRPWLPRKIPTTLCLKGKALAKFQRIQEKDLFSEESENV